MLTILVINNAEPGITIFAKPIEKIIKDAGSESELIEYADCLNSNFDEFDGIILTGSPQGNDIVEHHTPYFKWIKNYTKPIFGICAGHHIVGSIYGSTLLYGTERESGDYEVYVVKDDPIFAGLPTKFIVKQMHNDSITLANNFVLLATSFSCKNQLVKHKSKPFYTCQFHPEFYNPGLILNFIKLCHK